MSGKVGWPASPGLPQSAGRARQSAFWRASGQKCCLAWLNFQRGGPLSKRVASHLRPPTVPYRHPFRFLPYLHLSMLLPLSLSLLFSFTRWILPDPSLLSLCLPAFRGKARVSPGSCLCRALVSIPDTCTIYSNNSSPWKLNVASLDRKWKNRNELWNGRKLLKMVKGGLIEVSSGLNDIYLGANHATVRLLVGMR